MQAGSTTEAFEEMLHYILETHILKRPGVFGGDSTENRAKWREEVRFASLTRPLQREK